MHHEIIFVLIVIFVPVFKPIAVITIWQLHTDLPSIAEKPAKQGIF